MSSLLELVTALFTLDFAFWIDHILTYVFWFFALYTAGHIFSDGKRGFFLMVVFGTIILLTVDILFPLIGFSIYTATGLFALYLGRMSVLLFLENTKNLAKYIPLAYVLVFFFVLALAAWGLV